MAVSSNMSLRRIVRLRLPQSNGLGSHSVSLSGRPVIEVPHRRIVPFLVIALVAFSVVGQLLTVKAAGTLAINPTRTQQGNPSGVTLTLSERGLAAGQSYTDYWAVVDPSGKNYTVITTYVAPSSGNYTLSEVYPRDFGVGAGITRVGQYQVAIFQTNPTIALVSAGQFAVGITDKVFYQRTQGVSIRAAGYNANDMVTVYISRGGISAPGFPKHVQADSTGNVIANWPTTLSTLTGNYTVSLSGTSTAPKNPPDSQWFIIGAASLDVTPVVAETSGNILTFSTKVSAPDGTSLTLGNVTGEFSVLGTSVGGSIRLAYDQVKGNWTGSHPVQSSDPSGLWMLQVAALDSYGNNGQGSTSLSVTPPPPALPLPPPPENPLTSFWFLAVITLIGTGAIMGVVFLRKRRVLPVHLQADLKAVDVEASRLMGQDFFKSIQGQLVRKKDSGEGEKNGP